MQIFFVNFAYTNAHVIRLEHISIRVFKKKSSKGAI